MPSQPRVATGVMNEFLGVDVGDRRVDARVGQVVERIAAAPDASFPTQMGGDAELEALYRLLGNERVTADRLLAPHVEKTLARIGDHAVVRVVHDTTQFHFRGDRDGLGLIHADAKGMFGHFALAVAGDDVREPLGVLDVATFINTDVDVHRGKSRAERNKVGASKPRAETKASRWERQALLTANQLPAGVHGIHVMDQEADDFSVFHALAAENVSFVIRATPTRLTKDRDTLASVLALQPTETFRSVPITARTKKQATKQHPARDERTAKLHVRWGAVELSRVEKKLRCGGELSLRAVHVFEPEAPAGEAPIEWMLLTNEPVDSLETATAVVDHYRARWLVEEYFKSLKTGCAFEKRQLCSREALERALALLVPVAWELLRLRHLARNDRERPATDVFTAQQLTLLRVLLNARRYRLATEPNVRDAMLGVAALGGHIKNNGDPGWQVLGRGYQRFLDADEVRTLLERSDQS